MDKNRLVHEIICAFEGRDYMIEVFLRPDGSHFARTEFSPQDVIISDGLSLEDALRKHQGLLPLAVSSRQMPNPLRVFN